MNHIAKTTAALLCFFILFASSCKKEQPDCNGNCYTLHLKGRVYDKISLTGKANIPVEVEWGRVCIGCTIYTVTSGRTDSNGNFNLAKNVDTGFFKQYFLAIKIPADSNYFINAIESENLYFVKRLYDYDSLALQHLNFELYPKVPLTIRLRRTQQDNFGYYSVGHSFAPNLAGSYYSFYDPLAPVDTVIHQQTAPDIFTKISWRKGFIGGPFTEGSDSLICTRGGNNTIEVNF